MLIPLLDEEGREGMRAAGRFNAQLMDQVRLLIKPGITTEEIDKLVRDYTHDHGHIAAPLDYMGPYGVAFPKSCCTSINDVVCHGIPSDYELRDGDIINVDLTTIVDGWHGDSSETFAIGEIPEETHRLVNCALECLYAGIEAVFPCCLVGNIGKAIERVAHEAGFSVVRAFQGHGIGRQFHQEPGIPHFVDHPSANKVLMPGTCFTIEPMINAGSFVCRMESDGWTAKTQDGGLSAQFEHTILMTEDGPEILTLTEHGPQP